MVFHLQAGPVLGVRSGYEVERLKIGTSLVREGKVNDEKNHFSDQRDEFYRS